MINIQKNIPLAPFTTFKIGGPAKFFVEVGAEEEMIEAVNYAKENNLEIFVLAGGSNILVSDEGFSGLVIKLKGKNANFLPKAEIAAQDSLPEADQPLAEKFTFECWAGDGLSNVVNFCRENSLSGLEWAAGIPGSVGGAVRGNAGAYGSEVKDNIESVKVLDLSSGSDDVQIENKKIKIFRNADCNFAYRDSIFKQNTNLIVLSCVFNLKKGEKTEIEEKMKEIIRKRVEKIPRESSPGSFFKNPETNDADLIRRFEVDTGKKVIDHVSSYHYIGNKIKIPAPWLIEEAGLKGKKMGGVMVSEKHANFVVNLGAGTAQDVMMLASFIKMKIRNEFGVQLKEEIQYVGF